MTRPLVIATSFIVGLIALIWAPVVLAQAARCGPSDAVMAHLFLRFAESEEASGRIEGRGRVVLMKSETGSWTLLHVHNGVACIMAGGEGWADNRGT